MSKLDSLLVKKDSILENKGSLSLTDGLNSSLINSIVFTPSKTTPLFFPEL